MNKIIVTDLVFLCSGFKKSVIKMRSRTNNLVKCKLEGKDEKEATWKKFRSEMEQCLIKILVFKY